MLTNRFQCGHTTGTRFDGFIPGLLRWGGLVLLACALALTSAAAATIALNPKHPDSYVVVKGDTLWDIAGRFLREPWRWPEVWKGNPQIKNPDLIYPGDVITLSYRDGVPELSLERGHNDALPDTSSGNRNSAPELSPGRGDRRGATVRLSPQVRSEPLEQAIPTIPPDAIQQFLTQTRPVALEEMENAPYVVASADEHLISGAGSKIYARAINGQAGADARAKSKVVATQDTPPAAAPGTRFGIFRLGDPYYNSSSRTERNNKKDLIGYEGIYVGEALLDSLGDPSTLLVTSARREVLIGDRLLHLEDRTVNQNFMPHPPNKPMEGRIVSVVDGVTRVGQYQVVALNLGNQEGVEVGHVFAVYQQGDTVRDSVSPGRNDTVQLPDERAGIVMVFRSFERMSYALVMQATGSLRLYDVVRNP